jgi:hypothetical protein
MSRRSIMAISAAALAAGMICAAPLAASAFSLNSISVAPSHRDAQVDRVQWRAPGEGGGWREDDGYADRRWEGGPAIDDGGAAVGGYGPDYGYGTDEYVMVDPGYGPGPGPDPGPDVVQSAPGDPVAFCQAHFKSYDPASGTYLGYDGVRHPCP